MEGACNALDMVKRIVFPPGMCAVDSCFRLTFHQCLSKFVDFLVNMEQFKWDNPFAVHGLLRLLPRNARCTWTTQGNHTQMVSIQSPIEMSI